MKELSKNQMNRIVPLIQGKEDVILWSCAEGIMGRAWTDDTMIPSAAMVVTGDFCFLLGNAGDVEPAFFANELYEFGRNKIIVPGFDEWSAEIEHHYPGKHKKYLRYAIKRESDVFDRDHLSRLVKAIEPRYHVTRIDRELFFKVQEEAWSADFCNNFSLEDYLKYGVGYVIILDGRIIAGASSYSSTSDSTEITIETLREFRRKGLAAACASALILECLDRGIYPRWDAMNLDSVALSGKLGYHFDREYTVYNIW